MTEFFTHNCDWFGQHGTVFKDFQDYQTHSLNDGGHIMYPANLPVPVKGDSWDSVAPDPHGSVHVSHSPCNRDSVTPLHNSIRGSATSVFPSHTTQSPSTDLYSNFFTSTPPRTFDPVPFTNPFTLDSRRPKV